MYPLAVSSPVTYNDKPVDLKHTVIRHRAVNEHGIKHRVWNCGRYRPWSDDILYHERTCRTNPTPTTGSHPLGAGGVGGAFCPLFAVIDGRSPHDLCN